MNSSSASVSSTASTAKVTNRGLTTSTNAKMTSESDTVLTEDQINSFHDAWEGIHDRQRRLLRSLLLGLAAEKANVSGRAFWLSTIENCLGEAHGDHNNNDNHEHAANVARFVTVLSGLSAQSIRLVHEMTEDPVPQVVVDNENAASSVTEMVLDNKNAGLWALMNILAGLLALLNALAGLSSARAIRVEVEHEMRECPETEGSPDNENAGSSAQNIGVVHETTEGPVTEVVLEIASDGEQETSSYHTALSFISSLCTTTVQCTDSAASDEADHGHYAYAITPEDDDDDDDDDADKCGCWGWRW